jgi:oligopeptide transport system substrate-binding protein
VTTIDRVPGRRPHRLARRTAIGAAALVAGICLLAACTSDGGPGGEAAPSETETADGTGTGTGAGTAPGETTGGAQGEDAEPEVPTGPTLRLAVGPSIRTLDPAAATDPAEGTLLTALLDPLVRLDASGEAVPELASSWDVSEDGRVVTFHLRPAGIWTNGDPVTAEDFEYSWKRAASPRFSNRNAPLFFDIVGAEAYNRCDAETEDCAALRESIGVVALDDVTLEVRLKRPLPWFAQRVAHWAFLPVHEPTITRYKRRWSLPENIVSNGPFRLFEWNRGSGVTLERWDEWRKAGSVDLAVVEASMTGEPAAALVDFEDGRVDACLPMQCIPARSERELATAPEFAAFPAPVTTYLGIGTEAIDDVRIRRAIAIGLDRRAIVARTAPGVSTPATGLVPVGLPGFDSPDGAFLQERPQRGKARRLVRKAEASGPYVLAFSRGQKALATQLQTQLGKIGLTVEIERRPPENLAQADLYLASVAAEDVVAIDVLEHWTCDNGEFCDPAYDRLARQAARAVDSAEREALEHELEDALTGPKGAFPAAPLFWETYGVLHAVDVEGLEANALALVDLGLVSKPDGA